MYYIPVEERELDFGFGCEIIANQKFSDDDAPSQVIKHISKIIYLKELQ